jgi:hypothetical protein
LRPTRDNIDLLANELSTDPHYARYFLYFTNVMLESQIRQLAKYDRFGLIDKIQEVYLDYYPLNFRLFSLNLPSILELRRNQADAVVTRIAEGIAAALYTLQIRPLIRYASNSHFAQVIGRAVFDRISVSGFSGATDDVMLLILDRVSDPLAALLHPWFYYGAIHELFNISRNIVSIPNKPEPLVFTERSDPFLQEFGCGFLADVAPAVARRMNDLKRLNETASQRIQRPDQIADIVTAATRFKDEYAITSNHMSLNAAINEVTAAGHLINVGELEQAIATSEDPVRHGEQLLHLSEDANIPDEAILRLLLIYALRYEGRAEDQLQRLRIAFPQHVPLMKAVVVSCGTAKRGPDDILAGRTKLNQLFTDFRGLYEANSKVLDQFKPLLSSIIERIRRGNLNSSQYPFVGSKNNDSIRPRKVIVFYIGGVTYAEMRVAAETADIDVIVGGTFVHNAASFIRNEVEPYVT